MRREREEHLLAEYRLREWVLYGADYEGRDEDLRRVQRKRRELGEISKQPPTKAPVLEEGGGD